MSGSLFVVATPIGNLDDISARSLEVLRAVALIAAEDTRRTARLLARYAISTPTTSLHEHNEVSKTPILLARLQRGDNVALVSDAGTPGISDPGRHLVREALNAGIRVEPLPGPSAVMTALMASGMPADTFLFLGFPPVRSSDRKQWIAALRTAGRSVVFFEAPHRIHSTLREIQTEVADCVVFVGRELTKAHETLAIGPISEIIDKIQARGEFTVVADIGQVAKYSTPRPPATDAELLFEFGQMRETESCTRRSAVAAIAKRHGLSPNDVYKALERTKKLAT